MEGIFEINFTWGDFNIIMENLHVQYDNNYIVNTYWTLKYYSQLRKTWVCTKTRHDLKNTYIQIHYFQNKSKEDIVLYCRASAIFLHNSKDNKIGVLLLFHFHMSEYSIAIFHPLLLIWKLMPFLRNVHNHSFL